MGAYAMWNPYGYQLDPIWPHIGPILSVRLPEEAERVAELGQNSEALALFQKADRFVEPKVQVCMPQIGIAP